MFLIGLTRPKIECEKEKKQKSKCTYLHDGRLPLIPDRLIGLCRRRYHLNMCVCANQIVSSLIFRTEIQKYISKCYISILTYWNLPVVINITVKDRSSSVSKNKLLGFNEILVKRDVS